MATSSGIIETQPGAGARTGLGVRLLTPSFSDCLFMALLIWLFATGSGGWLGLVADADTGWHIRTGEYILDHGRVPTVDLFSFSKPGAPWYAWEWLSDVLFALLHRWAGLKGIVLFAAALISLTATLLFRYMAWRGANAFAALAVSLLCVGASSMHFLARPHLFTLLALAAALWMIDADLRHPSARLWLLVPITIVWVNLHGGFLALIACLGLLVLVFAGEALFSGQWQPVRRYGSLTALCAAASLVNPYGWGLHTHIAAYLRSDWIRNTIQEFQAPTFRSESALQFEILLFLGLPTAFWLVRQRQFAPALWIGFWGHQALGSARHVPVFAVVAGPLIASALTELWNHWTAGAPKNSVRAILGDLATDMGSGIGRNSVWCLALVIGLAASDTSVRWPRDFPDVTFPVRMVTQYKDRLAAARVFTMDQWADYLIYHNYPRQRVFCDGRSDFFGKEIGQEYLHMLQGRSDWEKLLARHDFDLVLAPVDWPLASLLKRDSAWRIVKDDGQAILFERGAGTRRATVGSSTNSPGNRAD